MDDVFIKSLITEKVKVKPKFLCQDISSFLLFQLRAKFEGKCSSYGLIKPGSIYISKHSIGKIMDVSLNGDIVYNVQFFADVCNPAVGNILKAKVVNMNKFGILAECSINVKRDIFPIIEIIVAKGSVDGDGSYNIDDIKPNDIVTIEVLGKKFELNDKKISVVGKIITESEFRSDNDDHDRSESDNDNDKDDDDNPVDLLNDDDSASDKGSNSDNDKESEKEEDEDEEDKVVDEDTDTDDSDDDDVEDAGFMSENGEDDGFFSDASGGSEGDNHLNIDSYR